MILDIHTHDHPYEPGIAIVQFTPEDFEPESGHVYSVGLHPWDIHDDWRIQMAKMAVMALHPQVLMIGEAGMDKVFSRAPLDLQMEVFREHVKLSEMVDKPLIIHCVKAVDELLAVRKEMKATLPWVIHGYRGGITQWRQLQRAGIHVSIGEFYNERLVRELPPSELFLETDDYDDLPFIYAQVSNERFMDPMELRRQVWQNIRHLLSLDPLPPF